MVAAFSNLNNFYSTAHAILDNVDATRVFKELLESSPSSGWALVKKLDIEPTKIVDTLKMLASFDVVGSKGTDLDAFYYVTPFGSEFRQYFPK